ncbi:hypothetical protein [Ligilactobacillus saerimneri]
MTINEFQILATDITPTHFIYYQGHKNHLPLSLTKTSQSVVLTAATPGNPTITLGEFLFSLQPLPPSWPINLAIFGEQRPLFGFRIADQKMLLR